MATVQKLLVSTLSSTSSSYEPSRADGAVSDQFPAGLRVLVVDDDTACLRILEQKLKKCEYRVTTCSQATVALSLLRERVGGFDVVISDVHMPDMDGFKLLELVGLEMDLPVIMMSADETTSAVMKGIKHGACDYLIKPIRMEELKNIWQHVIRKRWNESKEHEHLGSVEDPERHRRVGDEAEYASSAPEGTDGNWKVQKKGREAKEEDDDGELDNDDSSTSKKPRVVWSVDLHQQFVSAVNQLGIEKAVPKRILELMNVPGLTRENVASHLQKFRLYLKRVAQHQNGMPTPFCAPVEPNVKLGSLGRLDLQALAASGQIPLQALAALHAELLGQPTSNFVLPGMDQPVLLQASLQGPKCIPADQGVAFGQPLLKCQPNTMKQFPQSNLHVDDTPSALATWPPNHFGTAGPASSIGAINTQNSNVLVHILQQQQPQQLPMPVPPLLPESSHTINVQPSCLVVPSQPSSSFHSGSCSTPANQNSTFNNTVVDCSVLSSQSSKASLGVGLLQDGDLKTAGLPSGYSIPGIPISSTFLSCSSRAKSSSGWQVQNGAVKMNPDVHVPGFISNAQTSILADQSSGRNLGFVGKGACIPSRFAVDDIEPTADDLCQSRGHVDNAGDRVKQEHNPEFTESVVAGISTLQHCSSGDLMGVLSK